MRSTIAADYPALGERARGWLKSMRFTVEGLPAPQRCRVERDGEAHIRWSVSGDAAISVDTEIGDHVITIAVDG